MSLSVPFTHDYSDITVVLKAIVLYLGLEVYTHVTSFSCEWLEIPGMQMEQIYQPIEVICIHVIMLVIK